MSGSHLSREFFDLVKAIGESKSKQEEDRIVVNEVKVLKARFLEKGLHKKLVKEALVRLIYVEMLGHDASFAYVHAIQLTAAGDLMQKKVGYLCAALTLSPEHEFRFMLVNQLQRDLSSANILEVSTALVALSKLITPEMIPALLPSVVKLLSHEQPIVRKKTVLSLYRIYQLDPESVEHLGETFRRCLYDKDPAVMGGSLCLLHELIRGSPSKFKDLVASFVSILKQVVEHRLPKDFDYHRIPAPWIQIKILKILASLGANDQRSSEGMYEVLFETMKHANTGIYVGYAIIYECVRTVTSIYPNAILLDAAAGAIARFVQSDSHNLKYLGVTGLAAIVRDHPRYAAEHQMVVLDCLEDPDETLKRKTLDLLFRMTNPVNAEVVVDKLVFFLKSAQDKFLREELVQRICELAERFAPNNIWYVNKIAKVFELGGNLVQSEVAHNLLTLLAEGAGEEDEEGGSDQDMRREACIIFYEMFERSPLPDTLLQVIFWTLGEYAYLMADSPEGQSSILSEVLEVVCEATSRQGMLSNTRGYGVSACMKICAQLGKFPPEAAELVDKYSASLDADLQQKCYEFRELARNLTTLSTVLPVDASCEDLSEPDFSFLDSFVERARQRGAPEYSPPTLAELERSESFGHNDDDERQEQQQQLGASEPALKYDAYAKPELPTIHSVAAKLDYSIGAAASSASPSFPSSSSPAAPQVNKTGLNLSGVKSVWGEQGYGGGPPKVVEQPAKPVVPAPEATQLRPAYALANNASSSESAQVKQRVATPEPAKPKELTEREKMAAALFGGVAKSNGDAPPSLASSGSRNTGVGARRRPGTLSETNTTAPAAAAAAAPPPSSPVNLLDFGGDEEAGGGHQAPSTATLDLLSALDISGATPSSSNGMDDLLAGSVEPTKPYTVKALSTPEFGQKWVSTPMETKLAVLMQGASIRAIVAKLQATLGLGVVEIIERSEEAILAGQEARSGHLVLFHAKRSSLGADVTVRAAAPDALTIAKQNVQHLVR